MKFELHIGVIDCTLKNLTVKFKESGPAGFVLSHCLADSPPKKVWSNRSLDSHEQAQLPLRTGVPRFLRKPYPLLSACQRQSPVVKFHPNP
ncbi:hypothetical protein ATCCBAA256_21480 [Mycobacterium montefiorense]|nr:hypothetical protein ATCCBAA256_21480 [Mycobacterium montefiorense]